MQRCVVLARVLGRGAPAHRLGESRHHTARPSERLTRALCALRRREAQGQATCAACCCRCRRAAAITCTCQRAKRSRWSVRRRGACPAALLATREASRKRHRRARTRRKVARKGASACAFARFPLLLAVCNVLSTLNSQRARRRRAKTGSAFRWDGACRVPSRFPDSTCTSARASPPPPPLPPAARPSPLASSSPLRRCRSPSRFCRSASSRRLSTRGRRRPSPPGVGGTRLSPRRRPGPGASLPGRRGTPEPAAG